MYIYRQTLLLYWYGSKHIIVLIKATELQGYRHTERKCSSRLVELQLGHVYIVCRGSHGASFWIGTLSPDLPTLRRYGFRPWLQSTSRKSAEECFLSSPFCPTTSFPVLSRAGLRLKLQVARNGILDVLLANTAPPWGSPPPNKRIWHIMSCSSLRPFWHQKRRLLPEDALP